MLCFGCARINMSPKTDIASSEKIGDASEKIGDASVSN